MSPLYALMLKLCFFTLLSLSAVLSGLAHSHAAAWTQKKGEGQSIINMNYYTSRSYYDVNGDRKSSDLYTKQEINPYIEYGWADDVTLGTSAFLSRASQDQNLHRYSQTTLSSVELFVRKRLYNTADWVVSVQPMVKLPGVYDESSIPSFGNRQVDVELRAMVGHNFKKKIFNASYHFVNLELALRHHLETQSSEIRFDPTVGVNLSDNLMFLGQAFTTFCTCKAGGNVIQGGNPNQFDHVKTQLSVVRKLNKKLSLQLGVFSDVWGKNIGNGYGAVSSLWYHF